MSARLSIGHISREHEDGDRRHGETENHHQFGEVRLISIVGVLIVDQEVETHEKNQHGHHRRHDHQCEIEIPHVFTRVSRTGPSQVDLEGQMWKTTGIFEQFVLILERRSDRRWFARLTRKRKRKRGKGGRRKATRGESTEGEETRQGGCLPDPDAC